jgi:hypothetical protein
MSDEKRYLIWGETTIPDLLQLKSVLQRDNLKRFAVLSQLLYGYINDEPEIRQYINRIFRDKYSKNVNKARQVAQDKAESTDALFTKEELDNIFDFLDTEDMLDD